MSQRTITAPVTAPITAPVTAPITGAKNRHTAQITPLPAQRWKLPPIGQGPYTTALWPAWLPRNPAEGPTAPLPMRCPLHGAPGEPLHVWVEHPPDAAGHGLEVGVYSVRVVVWCTTCDRAVASEERVRFVPGRWRDRGGQLLRAAMHDTYVREHALRLFHAFARGGWRLYDQLYATQEARQEGSQGRAPTDNDEPERPERPEGVA